MPNDDVLATPVVAREFANNSLLADESVAMHGQTSGQQLSTGSHSRSSTPSGHSRQRAATPKAHVAEKATAARHTPKRTTPPQHENQPPSLFSAAKLTDLEITTEPGGKLASPKIGYLPKVLLIVAIKDIP